ncbi:zf-HC2 domain-containing protein [Rhizohabitans arisaemae]|uniref:zf-HC2 domain-containing protein n=1 Tax=Rhizohabitans arisaemae TaxID=2720610 RepID=UPI0024B19410|nr:zf-HC2 domain-containing protein [Rhizohabitans arisaemae]
MNGRWHPPDELVARYAQGRLDPVQVMSVEAHIAGCPSCRTAVPCDRGWLAASWAGIEDVVDRPRPSFPARVLARMGVPEHLAAFLAAAPGLTRGWLVAVSLTLGFAVAAAHLVARDPAPAFHALLPFLVIAPVLPVAGIALAYGRHADPLYELQAATPLGGSRGLLLRAIAVLGAAIGVAGVATPFLPGTPGLAAAWLLPAFALTAAALALSTRFPPPESAAVLGAAWPVSVTVLGGLIGDRLVFFSAAAQILYGAAALLLILVVYLRRARLDPGEPRWNPL